jgi:hypothetical protein
VTSARNPLELALRVNVWDVTCAHLFFGQGGTKNVFSRYVEIGRVCLITNGPDSGKLCVIVDVVDGENAVFFAFALTRFRHSRFG